MNVLVYAGPEAAPASLQHTLASLRSLLTCRYAVQPISAQSLASHPWTAACSLLVFPAGRAPSLPAPATSRIQAFVENGGALLAFGVGATHERGLGETEADLFFLDRMHGTSLHPTFRTITELLKPGLVSVQLTNDHPIRPLRDLLQIRQPPVFGSFVSSNIKVWAKYLPGEGNGGTAVLSCNIGAGKVILCGPNVEHPLSKEDEIVSTMSSEELIQAEQQRRRVLWEMLRELGLESPSSDESLSPTPLPQFLTSHPAKPWLASQVLAALGIVSPAADVRVFQDANDAFHFHWLEKSHQLFEAARSRSSPPPIQTIKHVIVCTDGNLPASGHTPLFDFALFYNTLSVARTSHGFQDSAAPSNKWGMGEALLYGELVTSTQTMLDKNPRFLSRLPTPFLSLASQQLSGRGRGSNVWLSPLGGLQFSLVLRISLSHLPAARLVLIQYLFGLAVTEACREDEVLGVWGQRVRLKWPNDIYATFSDRESDTTKIGGVLVTTSFTGGNVDLVIGCGLNVANAPPIPSLSQLLPEGLSPPKVECTAAIIMAKFERMWDTFIAHSGSFEPFIDLYLERWLHSDQLVTLTTTVPPTDVRIVTITEHGLLRTVPESRSWSRWDDGFIDLQPDGNSFDMMAGLIKVKNSW